MQKKSALWLTLILSALLLLVTACGSNTSLNSTHAAPTVPAGENIYVLDGYSPGGVESAGQHFVAFHPGSTNPTALKSLPAGLTSQDHQRIYTATPQGSRTTIAIVNSSTGATMHTFAILGTYSTTGHDFDNAVISANGQWLAMRQYISTTNMTSIAFVDTQAAKLIKTIKLNGDFTLDAMSPAGKALYLLEKLNDTPGHYYVRVYELAENQLLETPIVDKTSINASGDPNMTGTALTRQVLNGGTFAYTLYIDTLHNLAFVHILPLNDQIYPPVARCIDLPVGKSVDLLRYYTLALSSDGTSLYAANGALGVVSNISLSNGDPIRIYDDKIEHTAHFNPGRLSMSTSDKTPMLYNGAALSSDQKMLYFAGINGIWAVRSTDLNLQAHYLSQQAFTGVALSTDSQTLYAVNPVDGIMLLDVATGQTQQVIQSPAHTPWGIAWITD